jgi:hypothetical protein
MPSETESEWAARQQLFAASHDLAGVTNRFELMLSALEVEITRARNSGLTNPQIQLRIPFHEYMSTLQRLANSVTE